MTASGRVVGRHTGLHNYTVGEGARIGGMPERMFIGRKNVERNEIVVVPASYVASSCICDRHFNTAPSRSPLLQCVSMIATDFVWIDPSHPPEGLRTADGFRATAQIRSLPFGATAPCVVNSKSVHDDKVYNVKLEHPIRGVAPGQNVVLYIDDWCLGGGTISATRTLADVDEQNDQIKRSTEMHAKIDDAAASNAAR